MKTKEESAPQIKKFERDENGLLKGTEYKFLPNGRIDWRAMVDPKWLYPNKENFIRKGKEVPTSIEGLKDDDLCIRLAGLKELLVIRGYHSKRDLILSSTPECVIATCEIEYIPNFETEGREIVFTSSADATPDNTKGFSAVYLTATAENRAFVRAIRNFLGINIVAAEELGAKPEQATSDSSPVDAHGKLKKACADKNISFEQLMEMTIPKNPDAAEWKEWKDIPVNKVLKLLGMLKTKSSQ